MTAPDDATQRQIEAADPRNSTWLSANAGSGKTRVLTDRVARLLLDGVDPQNILCLTYTKAAASEMQNRLFRRLGAWSMLDDGPLRADLVALGIEDLIDQSRLADARRLFARAIETPGGLKIQTIHSFCAGLLRRFPLEAGVSPRFAEMDDRMALLLRTEVVDGIAMGPQRPLLDALLGQFSGDALDNLLREIVARRDAFAAEADPAALAARLGVQAGLDREGLLRQVLPPQSAAVLSALMALCRTGKSSDLRAAEKLSGVNADNPGLRDLAVLEDIFLFGKDAKTPFGAKIGSFPTSALRGTNPDLTAAVEAMMAVVEAARPQRLALMALDRTLRLHDFARVFLPAYDAVKLRRGALDFDDLIRKARQLLTDDAVAQWVLFRLDGGIDHILVDEAQDTSPDQWDVVERLSQEFAAGTGARDGRTRTIFVVGDRKQSIYSFQGADPEAFDRMRSLFGQRTLAGLVPLELEYSFRSSPAILAVVDQTFVGEQRAGLGDHVYHRAFNADMPGRVDLWPVIPKAEAVDDREWTDPLDRPGALHHDRLLADRIADAIATMIETETIAAKVEGFSGYVQRPVTPGDVLILVQRRSTLFHEIIRACKSRGLSIAGADRLRVGGELAVRDIAAVLRFLALPEDDLSLACALRSPLLGWDEPTLYRLAQGRPSGQFLWQALRDAPDHAETREILDDLRQQADFLRPYDLIMRLLLHHGGRQALIARLGSEAEDGIDALLAQALAYETTEVPGLTGFLEWMDTDAQEVKRQSDSIGDRIRVMTVHGAKGLEAPIVFLPDTAKRREAVRQVMFGGRGEALWGGAVDDMPLALCDLREAAIDAQRRERQRLLYVGMTRAESWLIVCGAGDQNAADESWYSAVAAGMERAGAVARRFGEGEGEGDGLRLEVFDWASLPRITPQPPAASPCGPREPSAVTAPPVASAPVSPSDLGGDKVLPGDSALTDGEAALARGRLMHLLLEHLPGLAGPRRAMQAAALVAGSDDAALLQDSGALIQEAMAILDAPSLAPVFGANAMAEVSVTAPWPGRALRLHGTIDRLVITPEAMLVVDFKTNQRVPDGATAIPEGLLRQMGAYFVMLRQVYPETPIEMAILWTSTAQLMPVPADLALAAFDRAAVP